VLRVKKVDSSPPPGININIKPGAGVTEDGAVSFEFKTPVLRYIMIDMDSAE
jgi:hypothetical protein